MAKKAKGKRMTKTGRWNLDTTEGTKRHFVGQLQWTKIVGGVRIAVFTVPKKFK
jgi:hypothetical protein